MPAIKKISNCVYRVSLGKHQVFLVGTAHVSKASVALVEKIITTEKPQLILLELDEQRRKALVEKKFKDINLKEIIKNKKLAFFIAYLFLSIFQKKIAEKTGSPPGGEFKKALAIAEQNQIEVELIDRDANITIKRLWRKMKLLEQFKLFFSFFFSDDTEELIADAKSVSLKVEDLDKLAESDVLTTLIKSIAKNFPTIKTIMIDERDIFMSERILQQLTPLDQNNKVAATPTASPMTVVTVVGAGHLEGMIRYLQNYLDDKKFVRSDLNELTQLPPPNPFWRFAPWGMTAIILGIFISGFFLTDPLQFKNAILYWVLANGVLSALGGVLALAHPITILVCFIAAPITSLNPMIGAGMVTSFCQAILVPPQIKDFENFSSEILSLRNWWKNRITKVFLVFLFSSIGSAIGTGVAIPLILKALT